MMMFITILFILKLLAPNCAIQFDCNYLNSSVALSKLIVDFSKWRRLDQMIIVDFTPKEYECDNDISEIKKQLFTELNENGISTSFQQSPNVSFKISIHRIGVTIRITKIQFINEILKMVTFKNSFAESIYWLFVIDHQYEIEMLSGLCKLPLRMDTDVTLALENRTAINRRLARMNDERESFTSVLKRPPVDALWESQPIQSVSVDDGNLYGIDNEIIGIKLKLVNLPPDVTNRALYNLIHIYKIRTNNNRSCVASTLGQHSFRGFVAKKNQAVEFRSNMYKFPLYVAGIDYSQHLANSSEDWSDEKYAFDYFTTYLLDVLNASLVKIEYDALGELNVDGTWSDVFGATASGKADIGVGNIEFSSKRAKYMEFSFPILEIYRSVYLRQPDSSSVRDIYLSPFRPTLLATIFAMIVCLAISLKISYTLTENDNLSWSDCGIWSVGILFMQGSKFTPTSIPSLGIVIVALLFGLILYNAYAAAITSTLSIQFKQINNLDDLLRTDFSVGFVTNGSTVSYLNSSDIASLQTYFKRGISKKSNLVNNNIEGLMKVINSRHAHFGTQTHMRKSIRTLQKKVQCAISEVEVLSAMVKISFPMPFKSPYRKIINLRLLKMKESGVLDKMRNFILPELPHCEESSVFISAKLSDVVTAFGLVCLAIAVASIFMIVEIIWKRQTTKSSKRTPNLKVE